MMLTPVTPPGYLNISQSENYAKDGRRPWNAPYPNLGFKTALAKPIMEDPYQNMLSSVQETAMKVSQDALWEMLCRVYSYLC